VNTPRESLEQQAASSFREHFGTPPSLIALAPGRVNLIGEHTDYNEGFVFPVAIDRVTAVALGPRTDDRLAVCSSSFPKESSFQLQRLYPSERRVWTDYVIGVASLLQDRCGPLTGANLFILGNVPRGAGLASSASLELAVAFALMQHHASTLPPVEVIRLCQRAENEFAGVQCGIMDQCISCLGKRGHALLLDCRDLSYDYVPLPPELAILVCDTGVRRALGNSEYNVRRRQCEEGVRILADHLPGVRSLRDVPQSGLQEFAHLLDQIVLKRCTHVVTENDRVLKSAVALRRNDLGEFGKLMYDSHASLRAQYEVSCAELDSAVDICAACEGVYGARMTGAGFGGCVVCALTRESVPGVRDRLTSEFKHLYRRAPLVYVCSPEEGASAHRF
jgi:galactokinase